MKSPPLSLEKWVDASRLLQEALTHSSYANESSRRYTHNERLEFLGDAVLQLVVSEWLFEQNPQWTEGQLSQARARIVCEATLAEAADKLSLGDCLRLGRGEERSGGRTKPSLLADAMEAVIGAVFLDGGLERVRSFIYEHLAFALTTVEERETGRDYKTALNEWLHRTGQAAQYEVVNAFGPDHDKTFEVVLSIDGKPLFHAIGHSKKEAEQQSARLALKEFTSSTNNSPRL